VSLRASRPLGTITFAVVLIVLFLGTALFRFMTLANGFTNDHYLHLASAQQMLLGDWPTRDFLDPGLPLMYGASALAQALLGRTLFAEAMLVVIGFAAAAVLTAMAVWELTRSRTLGVLAALLEVAIVPRAYGYPKILLYAGAFYLLQRYVTRPTTGRLFALAGMVVIAFLFRHDHGIYLAAAGLIATVLVDGPRIGYRGVRRAAMLAAMIALLTAPYLLYVEMNVGLWPYVQRGLEFRAVELRRQGFAWPSLTGDGRPEAILFYGYWMLPVAAALMLLAYRKRADAGVMVARVAPIIVVALAVNASFLRDPLIGRLQDAIVPAVALGAWLLSCAWQAQPRWMWQPACALLIVLAAASVMAVGRTVDQLARAGMLVTWTRWPEFVRETSARLHAPHAEKVLPSRVAVAAAPFYDYVDRCTSPDDRLLVVGNFTEVLFFSQRAFAGGQPAFVQGYYQADAYQETVLQKLKRETVPFVLIPGTAYSRDFDSLFPIVAGHVRARYVPLVTLGDSETGVEVLLDRTLPAAARDAATGWPCWRQSGDGGYDENTVAPSSTVPGAT
jgi:hypothetical protein